MVSFGTRATLVAVAAAGVPAAADGVGLAVNKAAEPETIPAPGLPDDLGLEASHTASAECPAAGNQAATAAGPASPETAACVGASSAVSTSDPGAATAPGSSDITDLAAAADTATAEGLARASQP